MKITDLKTTIVHVPFPKEFKPSWAPGFKQKTQGKILVEIFTDEGLVGFSGQTTHTGSGHVEAITIQEAVKPKLIGMDPFETEKITKIVKGARGHGARVGVVVAAIWDLIGKACSQPVYKLLGGWSNHLKVYASFGEIRTAEERQLNVQRIYDEGFKAVKLRFHHDDFKKDLEIIEAVRKTIGDKMEIMVDANQAGSSNAIRGPRWTVNTAVKVAKELENYNVRWLEEPLDHEDIDGLRLLRSKVNIPIAGGEGSFTPFEFENFLVNECYDIIQPDCVLTGGILEVKKIAALAEARNRECIPHAWASGIGLIADAHVIASCSNASYLEYPYDPPSLTTDAFFGIINEKVQVDEEGYITLPEGPGLGVSLDRDIIDKYGYTVNVERSFQ